MASVSVTALADELGKMAAELAAASRLKKRADEIKVILRDHVERKKPAPDKVTRIRGRLYVVTVGAFPPAKVLKVSLLKLFKRLGLARFLAVVSVTIKALELELDPAECEALLQPGHGPTRPVTVRPK